MWIFDVRTILGLNLPISAHFWITFWSILKVSSRTEGGVLRPFGLSSLVFKRVTALLKKEVIEGGSARPLPPATLLLLLHIFTLYPSIFWKNITRFDGTTSKCVRIVSLRLPPKHTGPRKKTVTRFAGASVTRPLILISKGYWLVANLARYELNPLYFPLSSMDMTCYDLFYDL